MIPKEQTMPKHLLQRLENAAENLMHAASSTPYQLKRATVGTSLGEDLEYGARELTHNARQGLKGAGQELGNLFEDVTQNVRHFQKKWKQHPEQLQKNAQEFVEESFRFLESTAEYLKKEGPKLSKALKHKIAEAVTAIKQTLQSIFKYFSDLVEKLTYSGPMLHAKHAQTAVKKHNMESAEHTAHKSKHRYGY